MVIYQKLFAYVVCFMLGKLIFVNILLDSLKLALKLELSYF